MPREGKPIESWITCPYCGAVYPDIRYNGSYIRDNYKIPQYYCKICKRAFSFSVMNIAILKPTNEVEIGNTAKIEVKVESKRASGIKEVKCSIQKADRNIISFDLKLEVGNIYKGSWETKGILEGKYTLDFIVVDSNGYVSIQPKTINAVQHYDELIRKISAENQMDFFLIKGLIWKESSFSPKAASSAGAVGLMQLTPITIEDIKIKDHFEIKDAKDPEQNIRGGILYLSRLIKGYSDTRIALGAYNWGPNKVNKVGMLEEKFPKSVKKYINDVLKYKKICEQKQREYYENN